MRTIFLATIPIVTALMGYLFSARFAAEKKFWESFVFTHKRIKNEVSFLQKSLPEILNFNDNDEKDLFLITIKNYIENGKLPPQIKFLNKEQTDFLTEYIKNLGTTDKKSQLDFLGSMEEKLYSFEKDSDEKYKKYRPLFVKLGFLSGLIIFILLI